MAKGRIQPEHKFNQLRASVGSVEDTEQLSPNAKKFNNRPVDIFQDSHDPNQYEHEFSKQHHVEE